MSVQEVQLRLFIMPCCGTQLACILPHVPYFCSSCGAKVFDQLQTGEFTILNSPATLTVIPVKGKLFSWEFVPFSERI